jgi:hypothetical protein
MIGNLTRFRSCCTFEDPGLAVPHGMEVYHSPAIMAIEPTYPKTTQPSAKRQRAKPAHKDTAEKINKKLDAFPDKIDVRDWFYQPTLAPLPEQYIHVDGLPLVLDQGLEGACTGFALAAVINYHLCRNRRIKPGAREKEGVSPRMLYEMARRYDEWPGEAYEGSSARGSVKGWVAHGVVKNWQWQNKMTGPSHLDEQLAKDALNIPAGAYFRVMHRNIRDMHAAISETGILFATLLVHEGWMQPKETSRAYKYTSDGKTRTIRLPVIEQKEGADGGHAIAIVGYTRDGFIIQNSWGKHWGFNGLALLPYEDWMLHSSDCWVVQLGVPVETDFWKGSNNHDTSRKRQLAPGMVPLESIRPYVINIGNDGYLSGSGSYWTTETDVQRLFVQVAETSKDWKKKRIMLYFHSGLQSEKEVARRVISFKQVCLENNIYPIHIMWENDFWTSLKGKVFNLFAGNDDETNTWLAKLRESAPEIRDRTFELSAAKTGNMLWDEMKRNAELASTNPAAAGIRKKAIATVAEKGLEAYNNLSQKDKNKCEIHIVAHSAGAIFITYAMEALLQIGIPVKSVQFLAPAISIDLFKEKYVPLMEQQEQLRPTIYALSDKGERDDDVGPYGKSLLYLVSNAFEKTRGTPLLGMERFINGQNPDLDQKLVDKEISNMLMQPVNGWPALVIAGRAPGMQEIGPDICRAASHGAFDNDNFTLNSVLYRILGKEPSRRFDINDLQ